MAEAFFERGIQNYIGAGWAVNDGLAAELAKQFYEKILSGETIGEALYKGRSAIMYQDSTWGAYQHYGQANARLVTKPEASEANRATSKPKSARAKPRAKKPPPKKSR